MNPSITSRLQAIGALLALGLAVGCNRLPYPAQAIAEQLQGLPVGVQQGDSTTRFELSPDRGSLEIIPGERTGDTTRFTVSGRWVTGQRAQLIQTTRETLLAAFTRLGMEADTLTLTEHGVELTATVRAVGDSTSWKILRDIAPWTRNTRLLSPIPLRLDRWRKHVVDEHRPGKAVFVIPGDIDQDGRPEILAGAFAYRRLGPRSDRWERARLGGALGNVALAADLDRDGRLDLIGTRSDADYPVDSTIVWLRGTPGGALEPGSELPHGHGDFLQGIALADSSATGAKVAFSWHKEKNGVQLLSLTGGMPDSLAVISPFSQDEQLSAADIDRDGHIDLVLGTRWLRRTDSTWILETIDTTSAAPDRNRVADINGDGWPDVVVGFEAISVPGPLRWYEQTASGWVAHEIASVTGPMSLDVGDLDGDGDVDVVVGEHNLEHPKKARLLVFENLGAGKAWRQIVAATGDEHHDGAQLVDIDGDGDPDIISVGWGHSKVLLYENLAIP